MSMRLTLGRETPIIPRLLIGTGLILALFQPVVAQENTAGQAADEQALQEPGVTDQAGWTIPEPDPIEEGSAAPAMSDEGQSVLFGMTFDGVEDRAYVLRTALWRDADIPVCWENPDAASPEDRDAIQAAVIGSWGDNSCLRFNSWGTCGLDTRGIRIRIADEGPRALALGSNLNEVRGGIVLNFTYQNWSPVCATSDEMRQFCNNSIAVHEFGHALGFAHEQNRWDTPGECVGLRQGQDGDALIGDFDTQSVMYYCNVNYNNNGVLSQGDVDALQAEYCKPGEDIP